MTRLALLLPLLAFGSVAEASSPVRTSGNLGIGLGGGTFAAGLSGKYFLSESNAVQATVGTWGHGWANSGNGLAVNADYLFEMPALASAEPFELAWNAGLGVGVGVHEALDGIYAGASGIAGLELNFVPIPIDIVLEYRPTLGVMPGVGVDLLNFSGHIRYFF